MRKSYLAITMAALIAGAGIAWAVFGMERQTGTGYIGLRIESSGTVDAAKPLDVKAPKPVKHKFYTYPTSLGVTSASTDTDGDGVPDVIDAHPNQAGNLCNVVYRIPYQGKQYVFRLNVTPDYVDVYRFRMPHELKSKGENVTAFVVRDEPFVTDLVAQAQSYAAKDAAVSAEGLLVALVQSISYNSDAYTGQMEYPKYPIETLVDQSGDCEDVSILAVNLIGQLKGYDQAAFVFWGDHMGVGIRQTANQSALNASSGAIKDGDRFFVYQEPTDPAWRRGVVPDAYRKKTPVVYRVI